MKSISILGCGWLGLPLATALLNENFNVLGSTTQPEKLSILQTAGIKPFLIHFDPALVALDANEFFASEILVITIPPRRKSGQTDIYLQQLESLRQRIIQSKIKKVVFISSTSVYREENTTVTEADADPESYLVKAEQLVSNPTAYKTTILRFGGLIGPGRPPGRFLAGKKDVAGGDNPVNIIHLDDCIAIIKNIIEKDVWGEIFNAVSDRHPTKKEFYTAASLELKLEPPQFIDNDKSAFKIVSSDKLKKMLSYKFIH